MSPTRMERVEGAIRVVLAFQAAYNRQDAAALAALHSDDCLFEASGPAPDGAVYNGKTAVSRALEQQFGQAAGARLEIEEIFGAGMRCIMRWRYHWDDAAGQAGHLRGLDLFQVHDGLIEARFSYVKGEGP